MNKKRNAAEGNIQVSTAQQLQQEGRQGADHPWGAYDGNHEEDNVWYFPYNKFLHISLHREEKKHKYK